MAKKTNSIATARKTAPVQARQASHTPRTGKTSAVLLGRKTGTLAPAKSGPARASQPKKKIETNFTFYANPTLALVCIPPSTSALFSLDETAQLTGVHAELLRYFSRAGLINSHQGYLSTDLFFDEDAVHEIRRIEHYRQHLGIGLRALPLICELRRASERLQIELRFLSAP
jgi:hypothetical protein